MSRPFTVVAIVAAFNEEDVIAEVLEALVDDGVRVYFLDDQSTDQTLAIAERFRGRGVIGIESLPPVDPNGRHVFAWERILRRKEELAARLDADWFIHHDADEFRESPWRGLGLADAIRHVDAAGYNAIDFDVLDFRPTPADPPEEPSVRQRLQFYDAPRPFDRLQIKCWKKTGAAVDLRSSGGHDAQFPGRAVFPLPFLLRHYPIRSQAHGERKVFRERLSLYAQAERDRGWHLQYDGLDATSFVREPRSLCQFDPDGARVELALHHRDAANLKDALASADRAKHQQQMRITEIECDVKRLTISLAAAADDATRQQMRITELECDVERLTISLAAAADDATRRDAQLDALRQDSARLSREVQEIEATLRVREEEVARTAERYRRLADDGSRLRARLAASEAVVTRLFNSRSWRLTAPLRTLDRWLGGLEPDGHTDAQTASGDAVPVGGLLRLVSDAAVLWPDGWAGTMLRFRAMAERRVGTIVVSGFIPAEAPDGQDLHARIDGVDTFARLGTGPFQWMISAELSAGTEHEFEIAANRSWLSREFDGRPHARLVAWQLVGIEGRD
jgi:Glycosyl transferase family 2